MKSAVPNTDDEIEVIEVIAEKSSPWGRIRIRESQGISGVRKCSIFLTPAQLEEHARECLALATKIKNGQVDFETKPAEVAEADRARYLGMTIEQYKAFRRESL